MEFLLSLTLPFLASFALAATCSAFWWKSFQSPWQFLVLALLLLLGLHRVVQVFVELAKLLRVELGGYFLEVRQSADFYDRVQAQMTSEAFVVAGLVVLAGLPLLFWLRNALPKV